MLTQHEYDNISSQKSCYSSDTNATVPVLQRYLTNTSTSLSSPRVQNPTPDIKVQPCTKDFLSQHFHEVRKRLFSRSECLDAFLFSQAYPLFKNPRGQCLIINVYNINGAVRRWSDLDVKLLSDLFRQLYFNVIVYSDLNGDDLGAEVRR